MKQRSGMPYDVLAFETDERAKKLTLEQEGAFHRLLRHAWINGSIPADIELISGLCRARSRLQMGRIWGDVPLKFGVRLADFWLKSESEPDRLINLKQESERRFVEKMSVRGKKSIAKKRLKLEPVDNTMDDYAPNGSVVLPLTLSPSLPSPPRPNIEAGELKNRLSVGFDQLAQRYPNTDGRTLALKYYCASVTSDGLLELAESAMDRYLDWLKQNNDWLRPKGFKTWMNNWKDWLSNENNGATWDHEGKVWLNVRRDRKNGYQAFTGTSDDIRNDDKYGKLFAGAKV